MVDLGAFSMAAIINSAELVISPLVSSDIESTLGSLIRITRNIVLSTFN